MYFYTDSISLKSSCFDVFHCILRKLCTLHRVLIHLKYFFFVSNDESHYFVLCWNTQIDRTSYYSNVMTALLSHHNLRKCIDHRLLLMILHNYELWIVFEWFCTVIVAVYMLYFKKDLILKIVCSYTFACSVYRHSNKTNLEQ